jgi:hypothetical protein
MTCASILRRIPLDSPGMPALCDEKSPGQRRNCAIRRRKLATFVDSVAGRHQMSPRSRDYGRRDSCRAIELRGALPALVHARHRVRVAALGYPLDMSTNVQIEVDERTADALKTRAAELGVTVPQLVAELAALDTDPIVVDSDEIAELDRRWKKIEAGEPTVPHERVVRWLRTWGTPRFRPWPAQ